MRADEVDRIAHLAGGKRQMADIRGHQIHRNTAHDWRPLPCDENGAAIAQRSEDPVGITDPDDRKA